MPALPVGEGTSCFNVHWSGLDSGSGLASFTIFVSDNGGPYTAWRSNTRESQAVFEGQSGHSYSFYSQARDLVGNIEPVKTSSEAMTIVAAGASCNGRPRLSGTIVETSLNATAKTVTLQLTNSGVGGAQKVNISQIGFRTLIGTGNVTLSGLSLPDSLGSLAAGASITVTLTLNVPPTVKEFSMTEQGNLQDINANVYGFSIGQAVFP